jgi:MoaA/NifB/PqqE/SkfB family radical SAM enzyme
MRRWFKKRERKPFIAFQIEPTSRCQLKCAMCPRTALSDEWESGDMPLSVFKSMSSEFQSVDDVHLQGWGEPLLHPSLFDMIRTAKKEGCKVSLTTNGVLLIPRISERLVREGVDTVAISVAGASKKTHENIRCGSNYEQLIENIKALSDIKAKAGSKTPKLTLSFLMTKTNIEELPDLVHLAKYIGVDELVATNLDYTPTWLQDDLKAFSCERADVDFKKVIEEARKRATKSNFLFRVYPLEGEEVIMCEMNPLQIVFITHDGSVSPCVYLNLTMKGPVPRIYCGSHYEIERLSFGNIGKTDFRHIWGNAGYKRFRTAYLKRMKVFEKSNTAFVFDSMDMEKLARAEKEMERELAANPIPDVCKTCYKAYGF